MVAKYVPATNFTSFSTSYPAAQQSGTSLDAEFSAIKVASDATIDSLALIQRADGQLANQSVGNDQLKPEVEVGFNTVADWLTATFYAVRDGVFHSNILYRCAVAHTSGTFATDLAAGDWVVIADFSTFTTAAAASATAAAGSATAALASQTAAAVSAAAAVTSATSASGSATSAAASAAAAAASAASIVYPIPIASGGTGQATAALARTALGISTIGNTGVLTDGTGTLTVPKGGTALATITAHCLIVGNGTGTPAIITNGTTGQVLTAATGADPAFQTLASAGFVQIGATQVASSSTEIDFTSASYAAAFDGTYNEIVLAANGVTGTNTIALELQFGTGAGPTWSTSGNYARSGQFETGGTVSAYDVSGVTFLRLDAAAIVIGATGSMSAEIVIRNMSSTSLHKLISSHCCIWNGTAMATIDIDGTWTSNTTALTGVRLLTPTNAYAVGNFTLYGRTK